MDTTTESTAGPAKGIQAIDKISVHRICSGQVVLNLATAIKELVENSIDAGATNIEIRLKDHGSELVEVVDNGKGVEEENFAGLTLKHHTSKLKDFSDLVNVDTFGFRGEALSSLCALSNLSIVTCHENVTVGTKLEYDYHGKMIKKTPSPRQRGLTVSLENLFSTLPVRHKEFLRNLKREFSKAIQVLNAYCMISTGVRITCTNQVGKGKKNIVVNTSGNINVLDNITNIFGAKQAKSLLSIDQSLPTEETCTEYGIKDQQMIKNLFNISGFVSCSEHGQGRSSSDRQFYFINQRPCDPQKISRLVNEVYHMYNRHQYPFIMMDISLAKDSVDVNVTPDKRQIFVQEEKLLLAIIKSSLVKLFEPRSALYKVNQAVSAQKPGSLTSLFHRKSPLKSQSSCPVLPSQKTTITSSLSSLKRRFTSAFAKPEDIDATSEMHSKQRKLDGFLSPRSFTSEGNSICTEPDDATLGIKDNHSIIKDTESNVKDIYSNVNDIESSVDKMGVSVNNINSRVKDTGFSENNIGVHILTSPAPNRTNTHIQTSNICDASISTNIGYSDGNTVVFDSVSNLDPESIKLSIEPVVCDISCPEMSSKIQVNDLSQTSERLPSPTTEDVFTEDIIGDHLEIADNDDKFKSPAHAHSDFSRFSRNSILSPWNSHHAGPGKSHMDSPLSTVKSLQHFRRGSGNLIPSTLDNNQDHCLNENRGGKCKEIGDLIQSGNASHLKTGSVANDYVTSADQTRCISPERSHDDDDDDDDVKITFTEYDSAASLTRKETRVSFSMDKLRQSLCQRTDASDSRYCRSFRARIKPTDNQAAEDELKREISKDMFDKMEILGQFNLGFIISRLNQDLFIVDQHASDEKYNFEQLQKHTVIQSQKLIQPQKLELTAANECILLDNLEIFHSNGFDFRIDEEAPCTQKVSLVTMPVSKNWTFGKDDIEELVFMLTDSPGVMCRPSRIRQMFASRSCRKSVMIGTALNKAEMKKLLEHMGQLDQPWNCPHGRPTMRHLINLDMLPD